LYYWPVSQVQTKHKNENEPSPQTSASNTEGWPVFTGLWPATVRPGWPHAGKQTRPACMQRAYAHGSMAHERLPRAPRLLLERHARHKQFAGRARTGVSRNAALQSRSLGDAAGRGTEHQALGRRGAPSLAAALRSPTPLPPRSQQAKPPPAHAPAGPAPRARPAGAYAVARSTAAEASRPVSYHVRIGLLPRKQWHTVARRSS
jgi:hypothetical protein